MKVGFVPGRRVEYAVLVVCWGTGKDAGSSERHGHLDMSTLPPNQPADPTPPTTPPPARGIGDVATAARRGKPLRVLITAGPTHEPIDSVRYIANRSSGRLGIAVADEAARRGWEVTLLLGPTPLLPTYSSVGVHRFRTTADLEGLLAAHWPGADVLIMAAAVADFRMKTGGTGSQAKLRRTDAGVTLELESTPDLLAGCARSRRGHQTMVGFALEPEAGLMSSAEQKLARKGVDMVVANPLETMDSENIRAGLVIRGKARPEGLRGPMSKHAFAEWLLDEVAKLHAERLSVQ